MLDSNKNKIPRNSSFKVNCKVCIKYDESTKEPWERFTFKNTYLFHVFRCARAFKCLPRPGGVDQQDPYTMEILMLLNELFDRHDKLDEREFQAKFMCVMSGAKYVSR